jgi:GTP-binding protein
VIDEETLEPLGDLTEPGQELLVARGGRRGLGNTRFKSSVNRAPRRTTPGEPGEARELRLQLKLLADVGLLGMPNAGKSTLIGKVSAARPKVADYPFTTLVPSLGVVRLDSDASFVMADIPGLIAGAAEGAGLGVQFLRHLARTRLLLHLVEIVPLDGSDPLANALTIEDELIAYSAALGQRPIWTVLTKADVADAERIQTTRRRFEEAFPERPVFVVSAVTGEGLAGLLEALMAKVMEIRTALAEDAAFAEAQAALEAQISADVLESALRRRPPRAGADRRETEDEDEDGDVEVIYVRD